MQKYIVIFFSVLLISKGLVAQSRIVDEIVAIVGDKKILYSDIEKQYLQYQAQGISQDENMRCIIFEDLLTQNLLVNQAEIDSIEVTEDQVEMQLNQRMQYYINQVGSEKRLEEIFNKSVIEMKEDFRSIVRDQLRAQMMRQEITKIFQ
ncbi:MAG: hypothetical protein HC906_09390 [Bacteroidales bacterium]|nr:hypothetical protein [Bacteroidales bacterium]